MGNVVITGGLGFLGSHLAMNLAMEHSVICIDNMRPAYGDSLSSKREAVVASTANIIVADLVDLGVDALSSLFHSRSLDVIIHFAAWPGVRQSLAQEASYFRNNVLASHLIMQAARASNTPVIMASSSSVYGDLGASRACREEDATGDSLRSPYALSKWSMESWVDAIAVTLPPTLIVRPFTIYGPLGRPDMAYYSFARHIMRGEPLKVFGDLTTRRDFTYVSDAVYYLNALVNHMITDSQEFVNQVSEGGSKAVINICNGQPHELSTLVQHLGENFNIDPVIEMLPPTGLDQASTFGDPTKLHSFVEPQVTEFSCGIKQFCDWLKQDPLD